MYRPFKSREILKVEEVATTLRVSISTIRDWVFQRVIPFRKLGKSKRAAVRFMGRDLNDWLEDNDGYSSNHKENKSRGFYRASKKTMKRFADFVDQINKRDSK